MKGYGKKRKGKRGSTGLRRRSISPSPLAKVKTGLLAALLSGLLGLTSWTLSTVLSLKEASRVNEVIIEGINGDISGIKEELEQGKKTSEMNVRLFQIINQLELKVNRIR